jgi:hypothetical protein
LWQGFARDTDDMFEMQDHFVLLQNMSGKGLAPAQKILQQKQFFLV